jgi:hypothetical protein
MASVFPNDKIEIRSPGELSKIIAAAKTAVETGDLRPVKTTESPFATDISEVGADGPWPDYLELHFEDRAGRRYKLVVETYHGAGGSWEPAS